MLTLATGTPRTSGTTPAVNNDVVNLLPPASLVQYLNTRAGEVTLAALDLRTGRSMIWHSGEVQATASIVKVNILVKLLAGERPAGSLPSASVRAPAAAMIEESDNTSATTLWGMVGGSSALKTFDRMLGMAQTEPSPCLECSGFPWPGWGLTKTSAADQVTLMRDLVLANHWLTNAQRLWALGLMENIVSYERWGLSYGVPNGVTVALKNGWVPLQNDLWQINSIGWIAGAGRDYVAAVLSEDNPTEQYGIETVDTVGSDLYNDWAASR
jgi:beta-lactamase class A